MTTMKIEALIAEYDATAAEFSADEVESDARLNAAHEALLAARPTEPRELAALLRWLIGELGSQIEGDIALLEHIAGRLEAMAGRAP
jgi:hypothetical protein